MAFLFHLIDCLIMERETSKLDKNLVEYLVIRNIHVLNLLRVLLCVFLTGITRLMGDKVINHRA